MPSIAPLRFHAASAAGCAVNAPWHLAPSPASGLQASVIIPAKDEADTIEETLAALAAQTDLQGKPLPLGMFEVLVLANNCTDTTAQVARKWSQQHPTLALYVAEITLPPAEAHVGRARRLLMDEACRRLEIAGHPQGFIASTDADTQVSPTWLAATAAALAAGSDAVGGRILMTKTRQACPARRHQLLDATYRLLCAQLEHHLDPTPHDPWPRHHQHFGASLALTAAAYRQIGGLPVVPYLEDEALYQALLQHDLRVRHCPAVQVFTSGRQQGRVAVGLSWQLREWANLGGTEPLVPHPNDIATEARLRQQLRRQWQLRAKVMFERQQTSFGVFWQSYRPQAVAAVSRLPQLPLSEAVRVLRRLLAQTSPKVPMVASVQST